MYIITYTLVRDEKKTEYKIAAERHEEACFIHQTLEYCRSVYVVTSRWPGLQVTSN